MAEEEQEQQEQYPADPFVDVEDPSCLAVQPALCQAMFALKRALYTETILSGDENNNAQQDVELLNVYTHNLDKIHEFLHGPYEQNKTLQESIPPDLLQSLPPTSAEALKKAYPILYGIEKSNRQNKDAMNSTLYGMFIHNVFHVYPYDMVQEESEE